MTHNSQQNVTQLLLDWNRGNAEALNELIPLVYSELRRLAAGYMKAERPDHTLQPTALVNEAYLCLIDQNNVRWQNRAHFLAIAARTMRHILVDHARRHHAAKRGGGERKLAFDETIYSPGRKNVDLIALDRALDALAAIDPDRSRLVELRFFGGLTVEESAEVLGVSPATVKRLWTMAKAWLFREIRWSSSE